MNKAPSTPNTCPSLISPIPWSASPTRAFGGEQTGQGRARSSRTPWRGRQSRRWNQAAGISRISPSSTSTPHAINTAFKKVLRACGLEIGPNDQPRSLYDLRHTYITRKLLEGVPQMVVAETRPFIWHMAKASGAPGSKQTPEIPCPMQYMQDGNAVLERAVEDDIVAVGKAADGIAEFDAGAPSQWVCRPDSSTQPRRYSSSRSGHSRAPWRMARISTVSTVTR